MYKSIVASVALAATSLFSPLHAELLTHTSYGYKKAAESIDKKIRYIATDGGEIKISKDKVTEITLSKDKATLVSHLLEIKGTYISISAYLDKQEEFDQMAAETPGVTLTETVFQKAIKSVVDEYMITGDEERLDTQIQELYDAAGSTKSTHDDGMTKQFPELKKELANKRKKYGKEMIRPDQITVEDMEFLEELLKSNR